MKTIRHLSVVAAIALAAMPYHQAAEAISIGRAAPAPAARPAPAPAARPAPAPAPAPRPIGGISGRQSVGIQPAMPPAPPKPAAVMPAQHVQQATRTAATAPAPMPATVPAQAGATTIIERDRERSGPGWGTVAAAGVGGALLGHVMTDKAPVVAAGGGYAPAPAVPAAPVDAGAIAATPAAAGGYVVAQRSHTATAGDWFMATVFWLLTIGLLAFVGFVAWKMWQRRKLEKLAEAFDYTGAFFEIQQAFAAADRATLARLLGPGMREQMNPQHEPTQTDIRQLRSRFVMQEGSRVSVHFSYLCDGEPQSEVWHFEFLGDGWKLQGITQEADV